MFNILEGKNNLNQPLVSVLFPVYNAAEYLEESLNSLLNQSYTNYEIIAIEDGSTDNSYEILLNYQSKDRRIKIIKNEKNLGLIETLNKGLDYCDGTYTARMDADDFISIDRFQKQVDFLICNPFFDAVSSWMVIFDENNHKQLIKYRENIEEIKSTLLFYSPISHAASMFKTNVIKSLSYRKDYKYAEDYDLWFRFLQSYTIGVIQEPLYFYRTHKSQSTDIKNKEISNYSHQKIAKNLILYFKNIPTSETIDFHLKYCMYNVTIESKEVFIKWDKHLRMFLKKKTPIINDNVFIDYVFKNYWQTNFFNFIYIFSAMEIIKLFISPFCVFSKRRKIKLLVKNILTIKNK